MNNLKIKLGQRIKSLRKNLNITQETLAELINMDITSLSKIETGRNYPQPETIEKIAIKFSSVVSLSFCYGPTPSVKSRIFTFF